MSRLSSSFALLALASFAIPAAAAAPQYQSTFKGDGFDASFGMSDGCQSVDVYVSGSDYRTKSGPGQPQTSNNLWGYVSLYDCELNAWGWTYIDQSNATIDARGTTSASTVSGTASVAFGHYEPSEEEYCYTYESWENCWYDEAGEVVCETIPGGEYCYPLYYEWVQEESRELAFSLTLAPTGDTSRGLQMYSQRGPNYMYRYRYSGSWRGATVTGTATLDGADVLGTSTYSWGSLWNTTAGSMQRYDF